MFWIVYSFSSCLLKHTKNCYKIFLYLVGKVLQEEEKTILLGVAALVGAFGLVYLLHSPNEVKTILLHCKVLI